LIKTALLFDLDGTIVDTSVGFVKSLKHAFSIYGLDCPEDDFLIERISNGSIGIINELCGEKYTAEDKMAIRSEFLSYYQPISALDVEPYGEIVETMEQLNDAQIPLAIVTNKPEKLALPIIEAIGLSKIIKIIICPEQVDLVKPDPEGLLKACRYMSINPRSAIYCGDHIKDICAAKNAKMRSIAVDYGFKLKSEDFSLWGANWRCQTPKDLCQLLLSFID
jgi:phosphoglycolate phosphatase